MSTLPQVLKSRIAFRCEDWLSEAVRIEAVKRRSSLQRVCTEALIAHLGLTGVYCERAPCPKRIATN